MKLKRITIMNNLRKSSLVLLAGSALLATMSCSANAEKEMFDSKSSTAVKKDKTQPSEFDVYTLTTSDGTSYESLFGEYLTLDRDTIAGEAVYAIHGWSMHPNEISTHLSLWISVKPFNLYSYQPGQRLSIVYSSFSCPISSSSYDYAQSSKGNIYLENIEFYGAAPADSRVTPWATIRLENLKFTVEGGSHIPSGTYTLSGKVKVKFDKY